MEVGLEFGGGGDPQLGATEEDVSELCSGARMVRGIPDGLTVA